MRHEKFFFFLYLKTALYYSQENWKCEEMMFNIFCVCPTINTNIDIGQAINQYRICIQIIIIKIKICHNIF